MVVFDVGRVKEVDGRFDRGTGSPDVVEENVGGGGVWSDFGVQSVGFGGLGGAGFFVGTDLDGVFGAEEEWGDFVIAELGEVAGEEGGVVKSAGANVVSGDGEGGDDGMGAEILG